MNTLDKTTFHFKYVTESDVQKETENLISKISKENITEYEFNGEILYNTGGHGHDFAKGFYSEYITKSGIRATQYSLGRWYIENDSYSYEDGQFTLFGEQKSHPIAWENISFPIVKHVNAKSIANDLISVKPKENR